MKDDAGNILYLKSWIKNQLIKVQIFSSILEADQLGSLGFSIELAVLLFVKFDTLNIFSLVIPTLLLRF